MDNVRNSPSERDRANIALDSLSKLLAYGNESHCLQDAGVDTLLIGQSNVF